MNEYLSSIAFEDIKLISVLFQSFTSKSIFLKDLEHIVTFIVIMLHLNPNPNYYTGKILFKFIGNA